MTHVAGIVEKLRREVGRTDGRTELECGDCLKEIAWVLLPIVDVTLTYAGREERVVTGSMDLVVIAKSVQPGGSVRSEAFVWELKAPQLYLFRLERQNRACPTADLVKAENQLLHYHDEVARNQHLLERWGIISANHVKFGGIIIGRDERMVRPMDQANPMAGQLAQQALEIRKRVFYGNQIKLWTWDKVLRIADAPITRHKSVTGDPDFTVDIQPTPTSTLP